MRNPKLLTLLTLFKLVDVLLLLLSGAVCGGGGGVFARGGYRLICLLLLHLRLHECLLLKQAHFCRLFQSELTVFAVDALGVDAVGRQFHFRHDFG